MDSFKGLVPEIYYDLIARFAAGVPLVAVLLFSSPGELGNVSNATFFVLFMGLGYIAGHLLTVVSVILNQVLWNSWVMRRVKKIDNRLIFKFERYERLLVFDVLYQHIDWAANEDANAGAVLKKMEAGAALSDNLLSAWLIVLLYQPVARTTLWPVGLPWWDYLFLTVIAVVLTIVLIASVYIRRLALIIRQDRILKLLNYPGNTE